MSRYGSSPRERGTRNRGRSRFAPRSVHPRASGEHCCRPCRDWPLAGSSPRERGTPKPLAIPLRQRRFIPARAGNTPLPAGGTPRASVHPRASGEHQFRVNATNVDYGSSPRERGTRWFMPAKQGDSRFIPARAGNTLSGSAYFTTLFTMSNNAPANWGILSYPSGTSVATGSGGENRTSLKPSMSTGMRRFVPHVSKS